MIAKDVIQFCVVTIALPFVLALGIDRISAIAYVIDYSPADQLSYITSLSSVTITGLLLNYLLGEAPTYLQKWLVYKNRHGTTSIRHLLLLLSTIAVLWLAISLSQRFLPSVWEIIRAGAIAALIMAFADAALNTIAINITRDVLTSFGNKKPFWTRLLTALVGICGIFFALKAHSAIDMLLALYFLWGPYLLIPLAAALAGISVSTSALGWGCAVGVLTTSIGLYTHMHEIVHPLLMGVGMNLAVLILCAKMTRRVA